MDVDTKLGASPLHALLSIQKLRVDLAFRHRIVGWTSGDAISKGVVVVAQTSEKEVVEILGT
jgi:hypothetical protein